MTLARNAFGDSVAKAWSAELELRGAGGEPVDLRRTLASHGVADLPPNEVDAQAGTLTTTLALPRGGARPSGSPAGRKRFARVEGSGRRRARAPRRESATCSASTPTCPPSTPWPPPIRTSRWAAAGAGRLLRSPTVFEDVVKTICTTNCAWSATVRMTSALVDRARRRRRRDGRRAFPSPAAMAEAGEAFYRDVARAGYRGAVPALAGGERRRGPARPRGARRSRS